MDIAEKRHFKVDFHFKTCFHVFSCSVIKLYYANICTLVQDTAKLRKIQHLLKGAGTFWELLDPELSTSLLKPLESESCENFWYEKLLA